MDLVWFRIWLSSLRFPIPNGRCYALLRIRDASLDTVGALLVLQQPFQELETIPCASQGTSCDQPAGHKHRDQHWLKGMKTAAPRVMIHPRILIWGCHMPASNPLDATVVTCKKIEHDCFEDDVYIYIYLYLYLIHIYIYSWHIYLIFPGVSNVSIFLGVSQDCRQAILFTSSPEWDDSYGTVASPVTMPDWFAFEQPPENMGSFMVHGFEYLIIYWLVVSNIIFIFHNIWDNPSHWLIFFKMVETTNQYTVYEGTQFLVRERFRKELISG